MDSITIKDVTEAVRSLQVIQHKILRWTRQSAADIEVTIPLNKESEARLWYESVQYVYNLTESHAIALYHAVGGEVEIRCGTQKFIVRPA